MTPGNLQDKVGHRPFSVIGFNKCQQLVKIGVILPISAARKVPYLHETLKYEQQIMSPSPVLDYNFDLWEHEVVEKEQNFTVFAKVGLATRKVATTIFYDSQRKLAKWITKSRSPRVMLWAPTLLARSSLVVIIK